MTAPLAPPGTPGAPGVRRAWLTHDLPGVGGRLRERPEDFLVDEQPLYQPSGTGEHIYILVQKRGMTTQQAAGALARHFGVRPHAVGHAGLKDRHALTRQVFSIHTPGKKPEDFPEFRHDRLAILWADLHTNKLRLGHLRGNRFSIRVRGVEPAAAVRANRILRRLCEHGAPNLAGEQRFGSRGNNHEIGRLDLLGDYAAMLDAILGPVPGVRPTEANEAYARGDYAHALARTRPELRVERAALAALARGAPPDRVVASVDSTQRRFWLTAFQSAIFNRVLERRLSEGTFASLLEGDLAWKHANGAVFAIDAPTLADPETAARLARFEISPSGPLWGDAMLRAGGVVAEAELAALVETGVTPDTLAAHAKAMRQPITGARRPLRVPVIDPEVEGGVDEHGPYIRCAFELPAGAFATVVMDELMKPTAENPDAPEPAPDSAPDLAPVADADEPDTADSAD